MGDAGFLSSEPFERRALSTNRPETVGAGDRSTFAFRSFGAGGAIIESIEVLAPSNFTQNEYLLFRQVQGAGYATQPGMRQSENFNTGGVAARSELWAAGLDLRPFGDIDSVTSTDLVPRIGVRDKASTGDGSTQRLFVPPGHSVNFQYTERGIRLALSLTWREIEEAV
jgi:hypothetical protein